MDKKRKLLKVLFSIVAAISILVLGTLAACGKMPGNTPGGDSGSSGVEGTGLSGKYYLASQSDDDDTTVEIEFEGNNGTYKVELNGVTSEGTFTLDGSSIVFNGEGVEYTAQYDGEKVIFRYKDKQYLLVLDVEYLISFANVEGFMPDGLKVRNGKTLDALKGLEPQKEGYRFVGWFTDSGMTKLLSWTTLVSGNMTLYAKYVSETAEEYSVTLCDGDSEETVLTESKAIPALPMEAENILGWWISDCDDAEKLTREVKAGEKVASDVKLYAVYKADNKLGVSVEGNKIRWTKAAVKHEEVTYSVKINGSTIVGGLKGKTEYTLSEEEALEHSATGEYSVAVTGTRRVSVSGGVSTETYEGKATFCRNRLTKPSMIKVEGSILTFASVANAQEYVLTFACADEEHEERLSASAYDLSGCAMPNGKIVFTVYAKADGYMDSLVVDYEYTVPALAEVSGLNYNGETKKVEWTAVENATSYDVTIGGQTYSVERAELDISELGVYGEFTVSVRARANGYYEPEAVSGTFTRSELAQANGLRYSYKGGKETIHWEAVESAKGYKLNACGSKGGKMPEIKIDGTQTSVEVKALSGLKSSPYIRFELTACAEDPSMNSVTKLTVLNSGATYKLSDADFDYYGGRLTWIPVREVESYKVTLPNGETKVVEESACDDVRVVRSNLNDITIEYADADGTEVQYTYSVNGYSISFETGGSMVETMYVALGDVVTLPAEELPYRLGYDFDGWYMDNMATKPYGESFVFAEGRNTIVYANWKKATFNLALDAGEFGEELEEGKRTVQVQYKSMVASLNGVETALPVPQVGYDKSKLFLGWYTERDGAGKKLADQYGIMVNEYPYPANGTAYAYFVTAFDFVESKKDKTTGEVLSYSVKKGTDIDLFEKSTVRIPSKYNGKPVDIIESGAFDKCLFSKLEIPNSIFTIELIVRDSGSAFSGCRYLEAIDVYEVEEIASNIRYFSDDGVLYFENEDQVTEYNKTEVAYVPVYKKGTVRIPDSVEIIPFGTMGSYDAGASTYDAGHDFTDVIIPYSVTLIDERAFVSNNYLASVVFEPAPEGVEAKPLEIGRNAFLSCYKLTDILLPARLKNFEPSIIEKCTAIENIDIEPGNAKYASQDGVLFEKNDLGVLERLISFPIGRKVVEGVENSGEYTIPDSVSVIASNAFSGSRLRKVVIGENVTEIEPYAFSGVADEDGKSLSGDLNGYYKGTSMSYLEELVFQGSDTKTLRIGEGAFLGSGSKLLNVTLPNNLVKLGEYAFANRTGIKTVDINLDESFAEYNEIDYKASAFWSNLTSKAPTIEVVNLGVNVPVIDTLSGMFGSRKLLEINIAQGNMNYVSYDSVLYDYAESVDEVTKIIYYFDSREGAYVLPKGITEIPDGTFRMKEGLTEIEIHAGVSYIGDDAFANCKNLTKVIIKENAEGEELVELNMGDRVFVNATALTQVELSKRLRTAGEYLFAGVKVLTEITIPEGVVELGDGAFNASTTDSDYSFNDELRVVNLPSTLVKFGSYTVIDGKEVLDSLNAFFNCRVLEKINVAKENTVFSSSDGVLYVKTYDNNYGKAVDQLVVCAAAKAGEVEVKADVTKVWPNAFRNNTRTTAIKFLPTTGDLGANFSLEIGENAFLDCKMLSTISLPVGLKEIKSNTFKNCESLKEVVIPYTVSLIEGGNYKVSGKYVYGAFNNCKALEKLTFEPTPEDKEPVELVISDGYSTGDIYGNNYYYGAFMSCPSLTSIVFPERMTYLGEATFCGNTTLKEVVLPSTLTKIGYGAFRYATALESVTFNTNEDGLTELTAIGPSAFYKTNIKTIVIPEGVTDIDYYAFGYCEKLTSVSVPSTVKSIGTNANGSFSAGPSLSKPTQYAGYAFYCTKKLSSFTFAENSQLEKILNYSFNGSGIQELSLPASLSEIGDYVFQNSSLTKINFAVKAPAEGETPISALTKIGQNAFASTPLEELILPETSENVTLGKNLFSDCKKIERVYLSSNISSVTNVFDGCTAEFDLTISANNKNLKLHPEDQKLIVSEIKTIVAGEEVINYSVKLAFRQITAPGGGFTTYKLPDDCVEIGVNAFAVQNSIVKVIIPAGVTSIADGAFHNCLALQEVEFEYKDGMNQLSVLGKSKNSFGVFQNCYSLTKVVLPNNEINKDGSKEGSRIFANTFDKCLSLEVVGVTPSLEKIAELGTGVYLPKDTVILGEEATYTSGTKYGVFQNCSALREVVLPKNITTIGNSVFYNCASLEAITYEGATEEGNALSDNIEVLGTGMFKNTSSLKSIKLPFNNKLERLPIFMFEDGGLETITIPANVKYLGNNTTTTAGAGRIFQRCNNLREVKFEDKNGNQVNNVKMFGQNTFAETAITEMDLSKATMLGNYLFKECTSLVKVTLSDNLTELPNYMLIGCTSFTGVEMNEDGTAALNEDGSYKYNLNLPETLVHVGQYTFKQSGLIAIRIPANVTALTSTLAVAKKAAVYGNYNNVSETFDECHELRSVIFEGKVEHVGKKAFYNCEKLEEVVAPNADGELTADAFFKELKYVGDNAFTATAIKRVSLEKAERFGNEIFMDSAVEEVYIANGMRYNSNKSGGWGSKMFKNCKNLKGVECDADGNPVRNEDGTYKRFTLELPNDYYFGANTFEGSGLKVVKFNSAVETIGSNATVKTTYTGTTSMFMNCVDLEEVIFEGSKIKQICGVVFQGCEKLSTVSGLENVEYIGNTAFKGTAIKELKFNNKVTFGKNVFENCKKLTKVEFSDKQEAITNNLFSGCSELAEAYLTDSIKTIGANAFLNTKIGGETGIIHLPNALTSVGNGAFFGAGVKGYEMSESATKMKVDNGMLLSKDGKTLYQVTKSAEGVLDLSGVTTIESYAFAYADGYTGITLPTGKVTLKTYAFACAIIPEGFDLSAMLGALGTLPNYAFQDAKGIGDLVIPEGFKLHSSATSFTTYAFDGSDITSVVIPSTMTVIPNDTFLDCEKLTSVTISEGVEELRYRVFKNTALTEVVIPNTVNHIFGNTFENCVNLKKVVFEEGVHHIATVTKFTVYSEAFKKEMSYTPVTNANLFAGCALEEVVLPSTLVAIGQGVFANNNIKTITIPEGVTEIGNNAFLNNKLETVVIPAACNNIGQNAFDGNKLKSITFAKNEDGSTALTTINQYAFANNSLTGVLEIPASVTTIGKYAFAGKVREEVLDEEGNVTGYNYDGCSTVTEIVLPEGLIEATEGAFAYHYNLAKVNTEGLQKVGNAAFTYAGILNEEGLELEFGSLTTVTVTETKVDYTTGEITTQGNGPLAYANIKKITYLDAENAKGKLLVCVGGNPEVVLPEGLTKLPDYLYAFSFITEVTIPAYIEEMGTNVFECCLYLTKVTFEEDSKLVKIGNYAFEDCLNLASINLPDSLESMGLQVFNNDYSLKTLVIPANVTTGSRLFKNWKEDQTVYFRTEKGYRYAFVAYDFDIDANANYVWGYQGK